MRIKGQNVLVLGLARSGLAVAKLLKRLGASVLVNEKKPREACPEAEELEKLGIPVVCGGHSEHLLEGIDFVVKNPGIPYHIKPVQIALDRNIPVVSEVEIAASICRVPIVGITGSNGKTTTTTLVGKMLKASGVPAKVAGNIGQALADVVEELSEKEWLVAELSSFQLKGTSTFHPRIGVLLNVSPAHLDYHQTFDDYLASKLRLFQNQTADDLAILNTTLYPKLHKTLKSQVWQFAREHEVPLGTFVREGWVMARTKEKGEMRVMPVAEIQLPGPYNLENALAATAVALACGADLSGIREVLSTFTGVEHRLEFVREHHGVRYYNDSKATNAQAAITALTSFTEPIIWICGGLDRGTSFTELVPYIQERVKMVIAYGEAAPILEARAREAHVPSLRVVEIEEAVQKAAQMAKPGEIVLLSPACASWDLYTSFEQRGSIFKQAVHRL